MCSEPFLPLAEFFSSIWEIRSRGLVRNTWHIRMRIWFNGKKRNKNKKIIINDYMKVSGHFEIVPFTLEASAHAHLSERSRQPFEILSSTATGKLECSLGKTIQFERKELVNFFHFLGLRETLLKSEYPPLGLLAKIFEEFYHLKHYRWFLMALWEIVIS